MASLPLPTGWERKAFLCEGKPIHILTASDPAETLSVPLDASGWQEVRVGLVRPAGLAAGMRLRVSTEQHWRTVRPTVLFNDPREMLQEAVLGVFNLSPQSSLLVRPAPGLYAMIAFARCMPVPPPTPRAHRRNVGAVIDGYMAIQSLGAEAPHALADYVHAFADSDFDRLCWGTAAGTFRALYFSKVTEYFGQRQPRLLQTADKAAQAMDAFAKAGTDPLEQMLAAAHAEGFQLWANHRICHTFPPGEHDDKLANRFFLDNQHMRVLDMDGTPNYQACLSLAYPEFRDWTVRFLVEQAGMGVDGIHIDFTRKHPIVGWEPAVYDSFRVKYGKDPRNWKGPSGGWVRDWLTHQSAFVTDLFRELRRALRPIEKRSGRRIPISVQVPQGWHIGYSILQCQFEALDVATWAREGLVDIAAPSDDLWYREISLDHLQVLLAGTQCEVWGCIHQRSPACYPLNTADPHLTEAWVDPWRVARAASDDYNQGAHGIYVWEAGFLPDDPYRWEVLKDLGDHARLAREFGRPIGPFDGRNGVRRMVLGE